MKTDLDRIAVSPPVIKQENSSWVVFWPAHHFGATILKDGTIGQFVAGFPQQDVEQKLSRIASMLVKNAQGSS